MTSLSTQPEKNRLLLLYTGGFVGVLVLSNILAVKMVQLGPFVFDGGTLLFPLSYIFGDVLTEVYGYKKARTVIWTGFAVLLTMSASIWLVSILPSVDEWDLQESFDAILLQMPRIAGASILGYFIGEYSNSVVLSKLKVKTNGKHLWLRTISSTLVGQLLDSVIFVTIAFAGLYPISILITMAISNYLLKTVIEILFTPITYAVINTTKRIEGIDTFDNGENYNPLPNK